MIYYAMIPGKYHCFFPIYRQLVSPSFTSRSFDEKGWEVVTKVNVVFVVLPCMLSVCFWGGGGGGGGGWWRHIN